MQSQKTVQQNWNLNLNKSMWQLSRYFAQPIALFRDYKLQYLRPDLLAGFTLAIIVLPQSIAAALLAELPPTTGLYTAIVGALFGALWGSSNQLHTGTNNPVSLLVFAVLLEIAVPGTQNYLLAAGILAVMVGFFQLVLGVARLGALVNFVSRSVIVGFTAGAGVLIAASQIRYFFGLSYSSRSLVETIARAVDNLPNTHPLTAAIGFSTVIFLLLWRRIKPNIPGMPFVLVIASVVGALLHWDNLGVAVVGDLPKQLPPLAPLWENFSLSTVANLSTGALAVGTISLVSDTAIARSLAAQTGQRTDSNQEFIGQGIANIMIGFFSGYPGAGSFSRSAVSLRLGSKTRMSAIFSAGFVVLAIFAFAPIIAFLPRAAVAGVLMLAAYGLIDRAEIGRIWNGAREDAVIMLITFLGTLFLRMEFAVLLGVFLSFAVYIMKSSVPRVVPVVPEVGFHHFGYLPDRPFCPQLATIDVLGDLYFGAVHHVEDAIFAHMAEHPHQRYLLLRMRSVNQCDFSGIHALESIVQAYRDIGGDVFFVRVQPPVMEIMRTTRFDEYVGLDHFLTDDTAIPYIFYHVLDPAICIYECEVKVFSECQNLPKQVYPLDIDTLPEYIPRDFPTITVQQLDAELHSEHPPVLLDVREPREFARQHIVDAKLYPLGKLLTTPPDIPHDARVVVICRTGRRSVRAAQALSVAGWRDVVILSGGMLAWEAAGLWEAVDTDGEVKKWNSSNTPLET